MDQLDNVFRYVFSSSLDERVQIKMFVLYMSNNYDLPIRSRNIYLIFFTHRGTLEGLKSKPTYERLLEEPLLRFSGLYLEDCPSLMVRMQVFNNGAPLGLPVTTSYKAFTKRTK